jgi:hypothetical protein
LPRGKSYLVLQRSRIASSLLFRVEERGGGFQGGDLLLYTDCTDPMAVANEFCVRLIAGEFASENWDFRGRYRVPCIPFPGGTGQ